MVKYSHKKGGVLFMYRKKNRTCQSQLKFVSIENLVPEEHLLRIIDRSIDFSFIYEAVKGLYNESDAGKPGIDPVVLFKIQKPNILQQTAAIVHHG